jgi:hypothetical protein
MVLINALLIGVVVTTVFAALACPLDGFNTKVSADFGYSSDFGEGFNFNISVVI